MKPSSKPVRAEFILACRGLVGVPYVRQARAEFAVDCVGILIVAAKKVGVDLDVPPASYGPQPNPRELHDLLFKHTRSVSFLEALPGDVIRTHWSNGPDGRRHSATHVGVLADKYQPFSLIHADDTAHPKRVVEVQFNSVEFPVVGVYRPLIFGD